MAKGLNILPPGQGLLPDEEESDNRCRSVGAAVQFAKSNNLLGVILNANLLVSLRSATVIGITDTCTFSKAAIPSLVQGAKEHGVVLVAFGSHSQLGKLDNVFAGSPPDTPRIDAKLNDGVLSYIEHILAPPPASSLHPLL